MTYRYDPNPAFWAQVKAKLPGEGGDVETFRANFRALTTDEYNAQDLATAEGTQAFLEKVLVDVDEVEDANGAPWHFSIELRDGLLRTAHVRIALVAAYVVAFREAVSGN